MSIRVKTFLWLAWLAMAALLTAGIIRWHVEYFRSPGPQFYRAALIGLPILAAGALIWTRLRTRSLWRYELLAIIAIPIAAAILREPRASLVTAAIFAGCYCSGRALCERCGWTTDAPAMDLVFSIAAGFALLNTVLFASGLVHLWHPWFFALLLLAPFLIFRRNLWRFVATLRALLRRWGQLDDLRRPITGILIPFAAILAACTTVMMLAPTLSWDAMKMHLPLARYYLQVHALEPLPGLDYSFFPQAAESLFAFAWSLGGQPAAQLITPLFFALSLIAVWILARDCGASADEAFAGVVFAASLPIVHWAASVPKTDAGVTFFLLSALIAALRWRAGSDFKWVQTGVLFLAAGFATKDLALLGAIPLGIVFLHAVWRQPRRLRALASLAIAFAGVALIWNARRFWLTGNPIAPFVPGRKFFVDWHPDPSLAGTLLRLLRLPWELHFHGHDFSETVLIAPLGLAFILFVPVWLFTKRPTRPEWLCLGFAISTLLFWALLSPFVRYAIAPMAVLALLTGLRIARFWRASPVITRASLAAACLWALVPATCAIMIVEINAPQLRYIAGAVGRDTYLSEALNTYRSLSWLRDHAKPGEGILGLENCSDVYAPPFPDYHSICYSRPWTEPEVEAELRARSFDWLVAPPGDREADLTAVRATGRSATEVFRDAAFVVYRLQ